MIECPYCGEANPAASEHSMADSYGDRQFIEFACGSIFCLTTDGPTRGIAMCKEAMNAIATVTWSRKDVRNRQATPAAAPKPCGRCGKPCGPHTCTCGYLNR